jgi:large subunit ribosomal protein L23
MPANVDPSFIIKRPLLTEKSTFGMNELERYAFLVDRRATKTEIKNAVQKLYNVKVAGVWTQVRKGRLKRTRAGMVAAPETKTATVRLAAGEKIELF